MADLNRAQAAAIAAAACPDCFTGIHLPSIAHPVTAASLAPDPMHQPLPRCSDRGDSPCRPMPDTRRLCRHLAR